MILEQKSVLYYKISRLKLVPIDKPNFKPKVQTGTGQWLMSIFAVIDYIWSATCQSKIYEK